jgi:uncharacterized protein (TIGR02145 family)
MKKIYSFVMISFITSSCTLQVTSLTPETPVPVVTTKSGRIWMDRNLGASQVATSQIDQKAYGDLYQWGRKTDGHQLRNSKISSERLSNYLVSSPDFIISSISQGNWLVTNNDNLWQQLNDNNVCPNGFRIPTKDEWLLEMSYWNTKDAKGAFESALKLPISGARSFADGGIYGVDESGFYWSNTNAGNNLANDMIIGAGAAYININPKGDGFAVRCIKN